MDDYTLINVGLLLGPDSPYVRYADFEKDLLKALRMSGAEARLIKTPKGDVTMKIDIQDLNKVLRLQVGNYKIWSVHKIEKFQEMATRGKIESKTPQEKLEKMGKAKVAKLERRKGGRFVKGKMKKLRKWKSSRELLKR